MGPTPQTEVRIVPSVLPADFADLGREVRELDQAGVDRIQWDVMDGHFVPNLTFGPDVIAAARRHTTLPFEAHLMVANPDDLLHRYVEAGCELLIVHAESTSHLHSTLGRIRELGARAGVALNPSTPVDVVRNVLDLVSLVLVMTVNPGFGGQAYLSSMEPKLQRARAFIGQRPVELEVDGGIRPGTIQRAAAAGATTFCAGSALFGARADRGAAVSELRRLARDAMASLAVGSDAVLAAADRA